MFIFVEPRHHEPNNSLLSHFVLLHSFWTTYVQRPISQFPCIVFDRKHFYRTWNLQIYGKLGRTKKEERCEHTNHQGTWSITKEHDQSSTWIIKLPNGNWPQQILLWGGLGCCCCSSWPITHQRHPRCSLRAWQCAVFLSLVPQMEACPTRSAPTRWRSAGEGAGNQALIKKIHEATVVLC